eukprot:CAMPEP_0201910854 /NCGR_PEP_ID=MMETSP0903-20130614/2060_1 /ASSEMBLY_ACC=CAM_ASM_000552 /TAXON_ID=420261 /ORGANISM="Thalassiosira antarctica, Strain CCMP982" /LENGTH=1038 /DNA_ID=CAMNT_0048445531 /DNA_START=117 /DNA_END=3233 /DNA_ORIENTATION=-
MQQLSNTLLALSILLPQSTSAQTNVGCDPSCPPLGYESDSSHLCPGSTVDVSAASRLHDICHPLNSGLAAVSNNKLSFDAFKKKGHVTVIANYYTGCEAGRRESGVYAGIAQRIHDDTNGLVNFVSSLKGGGSCSMWAGTYQSDALSMGLNDGVKPSTMPLTVSDESYDLRDHFFTPPFPHPSYIVLDENLEVTYKSVGPCCGYSNYYACTDNVALGLDKMLTDKIYEIHDKQLRSMDETTTKATPTTVMTEPTTAAESTTTTNINQPFDSSGCQSTTFSEWSACSKTCGDGGIQFRYRVNFDQTVETQPCPSEVASTLPECSEQCVIEFGNEFDITVIASNLNSPRDLAFHPTPGIHLGSYSEGRTFHPNEGEELWVANGYNHSISIIASLGTEYQTTISRRDRGYYHYMNNITALAFNTVNSSPRNADQDTFNYFALCNDNINDYVGSKEPNYFMGPTLYDTNTVNNPGKKNTVNRAGDDCSDPADQCFFLHADMLHEAPACIGIAHDPEVETAYGAVYWAFDTTGDNSGYDGGQLVKFDFSQPHGPGSMDHSIAAVRRYPEVKLYREDGNSDQQQQHAGHHAGMVVHPTKRVLYIANPGKGTVVAVHIDTGRYSRTAREEYPIFSNRLPSFEYSIYECVEQEDIFAGGLDNPSGLVLSLDGTKLFVAERGGRIVALEVESGMVLQSIDLSPLGYTSIGGLTISPTTGALYFVDMNMNQVVRIDAAQVNDGECVYQSRVNAISQSALETAQTQVDVACGENTFSLTRDYSCQVDGTIPNGTLFEQVHTDTGYASDNPDVQSMAGMDEAAALLANRTDCEYDSELNLDALLLGGFYCHVCLPRNYGSSCDAGGTCANVQWEGFTCDNEYYVDFDDKNADAPSLMISSLHYDTTYPKNSKLELSRGVTYRFTIRTGAGQPVSIGTVPDFSDKISLAESSVKSLSSNTIVTNGPILLTVDDATPDCLYMTSPGTQSVTLIVEGAKECPDTSNIIPGDDSNSGVPGDLLPEAKSSAEHAVLYFGGFFAVMFVTLSWTISY